MDLLEAVEVFLVRGCADRARVEFAQIMLEHLEILHIRAHTVIVGHELFDVPGHGRLALAFARLAHTAQFLEPRVHRFLGVFAERAQRRVHPCAVCCAMPGDTRTSIEAEHARGALLVAGPRPEIPVERLLEQLHACLVQCRRLFVAVRVEPCARGPVRALRPRKLVLGAREAFARVGEPDLALPLARLEFGEGRVGEDAFDFVMQHRDASVRRLHVDVGPIHAQHRLRKVTLRLKLGFACTDALDLLVRAVHLLLKLFKLIGEFAQVAFRHKTDDLVDILGAVAAVRAVLDLAVLLHLARAHVAVVDVRHAPCVRPRIRHARPHPVGERRFLIERELAGHPAFAWLAMVVLLHIHELPVAACHRRMRNLADRARESVFIPLVHKDDGCERRVDDVPSPCATAPRRPAHP